MNRTPPLSRTTSPPRVSYGILTLRCQGRRRLCCCFSFSLSISFGACVSHRAGPAVGAPFLVRGRCQERSLGLSSVGAPLTPRTTPTPGIARSPLRARRRARGRRVLAPRRAVLRCARLDERRARRLVRARTSRVSAVMTRRRFRGELLTADTTCGVRQVLSRHAPARRQVRPRGVLRAAARVRAQGPVDAAGRRVRLQLPQAERRGAEPAAAPRGGDVLPRVRPRHAPALQPREARALLRHARRARLRRGNGARPTIWTERDRMQRLGRIRTKRDRMQRLGRGPRALDDPDRDA